LRRTDEEKFKLSEAKLAKNGTREQCYDFKNISAENIQYVITASLCKQYQNTGCKEKTPIFSPKIGGIARNCDHI
jgi:hypothetical protein